MDFLSLKKRNVFSACNPHPLKMYESTLFEYLELQNGWLEIKLMQGYLIDADFFST